MQPVFFVYHVYSATGDHVVATIDKESETQNEVYEKVKKILIDKNTGFEIISEKDD